jgi:protein SCO1/2
MKNCTIPLLLFAASSYGQAPRLPEAKIVDQDGRRLSFYSDLVKGHTVAINFIFTSCTTICPVLAANFHKLQQDLGEGDKGVRLISISVDPVTDTPDRLKRFAERYHASPGWSLVTGEKGEIDALLGALGLPVRNKLEHTPAVLIGNEAAGYWQRMDGLGSTEVLLREVRKASALQPVAQNPTEAQSAKYFPNLELLTQDGTKVRFYDDLLKGKTVIINSLFTSCTGVCSPMTANLARVQKILGDRVGRDIVMLSISVDPEVDTPAVLKAYANKFGARPGWYFLTGDKANVKGVLAKLGSDVEDRNQHSTQLLIGNVPHGGWRKVLAMGEATAIANVTLDIAR